VVSQDLQGLAVLLYDSPCGRPDHFPQLPGRHDSQLAVSKLLDRDLGACGITAVLQGTRESYHIAVADAPHLHDVHW